VQNQADPSLQSRKNLQKYRTNALLIREISACRKLRLLSNKTLLAIRQKRARFYAKALYLIAKGLSHLSKNIASF